MSPQEHKHPTPAGKCGVEQEEQKSVENVLVTNVPRPWSIKAKINT